MCVDGQDDMMTPGSLNGMVRMMARLMMEDSAAVLIVAKPGPLRDGVQALIGAMPQVGAVCEIDDLSSSASSADVAGCPDLVLLSCGTGGGLAGLMVRQVRARWPQARCITLVGSVEQQREAELAGADAVVLNGLPAQKLFRIIAGALN
jgi:DNA-binding NarL/FixJ family response regulator